MSHAAVLVIGPKPEDQLAPFSENLDVAPYQRTCDCGDWKANREATARAERRTGLTYDGLREAFNVRPMNERTDEAWKAHIKPLQDAEAIARAEIDAKPDPECDDCHGAGHYQSTYNPESKWDWYVLGGRYTGFFQLKFGQEGQIGEPGVMTSPVTDDDLADSALKGSIDFEAMRATSDKPLATFAVLKDGVWYERGSLGWFGTVSDEKDPEAWHREWNNLVDDLPDDTLLSVYDIHI